MHNTVYIGVLSLGGGSEGMVGIPRAWGKTKFIFWHFGKGIMKINNSLFCKFKNILFCLFLTLLIAHILHFVVVCFKIFDVMVASGDITDLLDFLRHFFNVHFRMTQLFYSSLFGTSKYLWFSWVVGWPQFFPIQKNVKFYKSLGAHFWNRWYHIIWQTQLF